MSDEVEVPMSNGIEVLVTTSFNVTEESLAGGCPLGIGEYPAGMTLDLPAEEAAWLVSQGLGLIEE